MVGTLSAAITSRLLHSEAASSPAPARPAGLAAPGIEQAKWRIHSSPAGTLNKPSRAERRRAADAGRRVGAVIKDVYDALYLEPAQLKASVRSHFLRSAGAALLRSRAGLPARARDVQTVVRKIDVSVQVPRTRHAVAEVRVVAKGTAEARFRVVHRSTLYLERAKSGWRIVAFDLNQSRRK